MDKIIHDFLGVYSHPGVIIGLVIVFSLIVLLSLSYKFFKNSGFIIFFEFIFEKIYEFFEDILGREESRWVKVYITTMFFVILISNFLGVFLEVLAPIFGFNEEGHFILEHYVSIPTADKNFNIAMAIIGVFIILFEQFRFLGVPKALYEYFPVLGKNYVPYTFGKLPKVIDIPLFLFVKIFDIIIAMFLGLLEIVGHLAKIISLSFRLFGNVTSGGILLGMLVAGLFGLSKGLVGFEFPILGPVLIYFQESLVSLIQALVFPLLIAIFIKVAKVH